jgi:hypothetical protein
MMDIASAAARVAGLRHDAILRDAVDYAVPDIYLGDPTATRGAALACGMKLAGFAAQVEDTARFLRMLR